MKKIMVPILCVIFCITIGISFIWTRKPAYTFTMNTVEGNAASLNVDYQIILEDGSQRFTIHGKNDQLTYKTSYTDDFKQPPLMSNVYENGKRYINYYPLLPEGVSLGDLELTDTQEYPYRISEKGDLKNNIYEFYKYHKFDLALLTETEEGYAALRTDLQIIRPEDDGIKFLHNLQDKQTYFEYSFYNTGVSNSRKFNHTSVKLNEHTYIATYQIRNDMTGISRIYRVDEAYQSDHEELPILTDVINATAVTPIYSFDESYQIQDMIAYNNALYVVTKQDGQLTLSIIDESGIQLEEIDLPADYEYQKMIILNDALCVMQLSGKKHLYQIYEPQGLRMQSILEADLIHEQYDYKDGILNVLYATKQSETELSFHLTALNDGGILYNGELKGDYQDDQKAFAFYNKITYANGESQLIDYRYRVITDFKFEDH